MIARLGLALCALLLLLAACGQDQEARHRSAPPADDDPDDALVPPYALFNGRIFQTQDQSEARETALLVDSAGRVALLGTDEHVLTSEPARDIPHHDLMGDTIFPAVIDSHVHLTYFPVTDELQKKGVFAAVDLAAPEDSLARDHPRFELIPSGPMVTAPLGYPTRGWGRDGYGIEVTTSEEARAATLGLVAAGARVIKVPLDGSPVLSDVALEAVVQAAHAEGLRVAVHALSESAAARAAEFDCDLLAHTPTEQLSDSTVQAWSGRAVVSTLRAFGGAQATLDNLRRLSESGARVLYGTDLGNTRTVGIDVNELGFLEGAGFTREEALRAATTAAADYWNLEVGRITKGAPAHFLF